MAEPKKRRARRNESLPEPTALQAITAIRRGCVSCVSIPTGQVHFRQLSVTEAHQARKIANAG